MIDLATSAAERKPWSAALEDLGTALENVWRSTRAPVPVAEPLLHNVKLSPSQIEALLQPQGLPIVARPGIPTKASGDPLLITLDKDLSRSGRIIAVLLSGKDKTGEVLSSGHYRPYAEHLGDSVLAGCELPLTAVRPLSPRRLGWMLEPGENPIKWIKANWDLPVIQGVPGDPRCFEIEGTPLAGTTILRLIPRNQVPIADIKLSLVVVYYATTP
jgi:hypothetical protein